MMEKGYETEVKQRLWGLLQELMIFLIYPKGFGQVLFHKIKTGTMLSGKELNSRWRPAAVIPFVRSCKTCLSAIHCCQK